MPDWAIKEMNKWYNKSSKSWRDYMSNEENNLNEQKIDGTELNKLNLDSTYLGDYIKTLDVGDGLELDKAKALEELLKLV